MEKASPFNILHSAFCIQLSMEVAEPLQRFPPYACPRRLFPFPLAAATIDGRVQDARGVPVPDAVVFAVPEGRTLPLAKRNAVMDQKNRMFIPHVLPVQTGTA